MNLDELSYRRATLRDAKHVTEMIHDLAGGTDDSAMKRRFRRMVLRPSYYLYVVIHQGKRVALFLFRRSHFLGSDRPHLHWIGMVVDQDYQQNGIATWGTARLVEEAAARGFSQISLVTQHEHLRDFYQDLGFEITGTRFVMRLEAQGQVGRLRRGLRRIGRQIGL